MYSLYAWGTPFEAEELCSFDPLSISTQAYLQFCNVDWQLHYVKCPEASPSRCLPALLFQNKVAETGIWHIVRFLQGEGYGSGVVLDKEQLSQTTAYVSMVQDGLIDAILFTWYLVPENFVQVIRPRLAKMFGLPLSLVMPTHLKDCAVKRLAANGVIDGETFGSGSDSNAEGSDSTEGGFLQNRFFQLRHLAKEGFKRQAKASESIEAALARHPVLKQADQYLLCLSQKLGEKDYFFGKTPGLLDAVVYGHLSLVIRVNLPHNTLRRLIATKYINLAEHCARVHARLRPPTIASSQGLVAGLGSYVKQTVAEYTTLPDISIPNMKDSPETVNNVRTIVGALCVFVGYIIYNGVLSTQNVETDGPDKMSLESPSVGGILDAVEPADINNSVFDG